MSADRIKWTTITDARPVYEPRHLASSPRPSLWQRTPEWALWLGTAVLVLALLALPVIA